MSDYRRPLSDALSANVRIGVQHSSRRIAPSFAADHPCDPITRVDAWSRVEDVYASRLRPRTIGIAFGFRFGAE